MRAGAPGDEIGDRITGAKVERSSFFETARQRAVEYLREPRKLNDLLDRAARKILHRQGPLSELRDTLKASLRLLRAWSGGRYRGIPAASLVSIVAALLYLVTPVDLIPDFIFSLGLVDDAALLGWVLSSVRGDIDRFVAWERSQAAPGRDAVPPSRRV